MAKRGSSKRISVDHEEHIAYLFGGKRSPSSGASSHDYADVKTEHLAIECKTTMSETKYNELLKQFEKVAEEAWEHGKDPMLAIRVRRPDSKLADRDGFVDLTIRRAEDDALREEQYAQA